MKICIVKLSAMGDIIHAMVALQFIKKEIPDAQIDWVVESGFRGVLENNPHIDNILPVNLKSIKTKKSEFFTQYKILKAYSKNNYDIVIDAQGLLKSAIVSRIIGGKIIAGFDKNSIREGIASLFYNKKIHIAYHENIILRNVAVILEPLGIHVNTRLLDAKESYLFFKAEPKLAKPYILFVIGSSWESKNYPKEQFTSLANELNEPIFLVWGNEKERELALWIETHTPNAKALNKMSFDELKSTIANASIVIGNDTGPTHMAWALNVPSITLFGPTPARNTYITNINKAIESSSAVNPYKLNKNDFSIGEIEPNQIIKTIKEIREQQTKISSL
ncbi:lipopolysaccharide heptosyltransferase I [Sulfurimonas sp.]|uniref:lipopolysaccharide heptosyltransferase I n=1 Tax=Sulfurimonas sp. TaxID=2022749 RepID=UPI0025EE7410|nr:lipopolysaccharide heptosyltransferase I [Sulfurimonas sp.]MDD5156454.1 lipopolysaccharide heptosyltransferase I [Sulfurimonas sp.]